MSRKFAIVLSAGLVIAGFGVVPSVAMAADEPAAQEAKSADLNGPWHWETEGRDGQKRVTTLKLKQEGEKLTGTISGFRGQDTEISEGTVKNGEFSFKVVRSFNGNEFVTKYSGKLEGDTLKGKTEMERNGEVRAREFEAKRGEAPATTPAPAPANP